MNSAVTAFGVPLSPWGLSWEASRRAAPTHEAPFISLSDMLSVMLQRGSILIVWTDHSRERGVLILSVDRIGTRPAELLWCLSRQSRHCFVSIVIGCLPLAAFKLKAKHCPTFNRSYYCGMTCYCSTLLDLYAKIHSIKSWPLNQFLLDNLSGR